MTARSVRVLVDTGGGRKTSADFVAPGATDGLVVVLLDGADSRAVVPLDTIECAWFAGCGRPAAALVDHPILSWVPACSPCQAFAARGRR